MERIEAPTMIERSPARRARRAKPRFDVYESNFGRLASDASWRKSGRQSSQASSHLLILAVSSSLKSRRGTLSYTTLTARDESSRLHLANSIRWAIATAGPTSSPASSGHLDLQGFYFTTAQAGFGRFYDSDGQGGFNLQANTPVGELRGPTSWRGGLSPLLHTAASSFTALSRTTARSGPPTERDLPDIHRIRCSPITWQGRSLIFWPGIFIGPQVS